MIKHSHIFESYNQFLNAETINSFIGQFDFETTTSLLKIIKHDLNSVSKNTKAKKRCFHIINECFENVVRHSFNKESNPAFYILNNKNNEFELIIGNVINWNDSGKMNYLLDSFKNQTIDEIKSNYRKKIKETKISDKGGAGLGLYDIIIKSNNTLKSTIKQFNEIEHFFLLEIKIS